MGPKNDPRSSSTAEESTNACEVRSSAVLNALTAHVAVLDGQGKILAVNKAWETFARANGGDPLTLQAGSDYLQVCRQSLAQEEDPYASVALDGLQKILDGRLREFRLHYPCHSPDKQRWFLMQALPLHDLGGAVVSHLDVTDRYQLLRMVARATKQRKLALKKAQTRLHRWARQGRILLDELEQALPAKALDENDRERLARLRAHLTPDQHEAATKTETRHPASSSTPDPAPTASWTAPDSGRREEVPRILLAEEDGLTAFALRSLLEQAGYLVECVEDGPAVLRRLREERFHLLLLDEQLPFLNGEQTARAVRAPGFGHQDLPIVCIAAPGGELESLTGKQSPEKPSPFDECLPSPLDQSQLFQVVQRLILSRRDNSG